MESIPDFGWLDFLEEKHFPKLTLPLDRQMLLTRVESRIGLPVEDGERVVHLAFQLRLACSSLPRGLTAKFSNGYCVKGSLREGTAVDPLDLCLPPHIIYLMCRSADFLKCEEVFLHHTGPLTLIFANNCEMKSVRNKERFIAGLARQMAGWLRNDFAVKVASDKKLARQLLDRCESIHGDIESQIALGKSPGAGGEARSLVERMEITSLSIYQMVLQHALPISTINSGVPSSKHDHVLREARAYAKAILDLRPFYNASTV